MPPSCGPQTLPAKPHSFFTHLWQYRAEVGQPQDEIDREDYRDEDGTSENVRESMAGKHEYEGTDN